MSDAALDELARPETRENSGNRWIDTGRADNRCLTTCRTLHSQFNRYDSMSEQTNLWRHGEYGDAVQMWSILGSVDQAGWWSQPDVRSDALVVRRGRASNAYGLTSPARAVPVGADRPSSTIDRSSNLISFAADSCSEDRRY